MSDQLVQKSKRQIFLPLVLELKPNHEQYVKIARFAGCVNKAYNHWLEEKNDFYNEYIIPNHKEHPNYLEYVKLDKMDEKELAKLSKEEKKERKKRLKELEPEYEETRRIDKKLWKNCYHCSTAPELRLIYPYLEECDSQALSQARQNLDNAFDRFYKGLAERPRLHSRKKNRSFKTCMPSKKPIDWNKFTLTYPKIGPIEFKNRKIPKWYKNRTSNQPKNISVRILPSGKVFASVLFEIAEVQAEKSSLDQISENQAIGLDFDLHDMYIDSNGKSAKNDFGYQTFKRNSRKLKHIQRKLSRMKGAKKGELKSKNYFKLQKKSSLEEWRISNRRKDWQEKESLRLVRTYKVIGIEDLRISAMKKATTKVQKDDGTYKKKRIPHRNSKNYEETSWSSFVEKLVWKSRLYDCRVVKIDRWYPSSQTCSVCGFKYPLVAKKHLENWTCPECGAMHQRDINAGINIKKEALSLLREPQEAVDCSLVETVPRPQLAVVSQLAELALRSA